MPIGTEKWSYLKYMDTKIQHIFFLVSTYLIVPIQKKDEAQQLKNSFMINKIITCYMPLTAFLVRYYTVVGAKPNFSLFQTIINTTWGLILVKKKKTTKLKNRYKYYMYIKFPIIFWINILYSELTIIKEIIFMVFFSREIWWK